MNIPEIKSLQDAHVIILAILIMIQSQMYKLAWRHHFDNNYNQMTLMCTTRGERRLIGESLFAYMNFIEN